MRSRPATLGRLLAVAAILVTLISSVPSVALAANPVVIATSSLPAGQVGSAYSQTLTVTDGTAPFAWAVTVGTLPAGLALNASTGVISGTPTAAATSAFTVQVTDAVPQSVTKALSITIAAAPVPLTVTTSSLPAGQVGVAYSQTLAASGGASPYLWAVISGGLPAGLSLNTSTGVISGTPTAIGATSVTVQATDWVFLTATKTLSVTIAAAPPSLSVTTATLPAGQVGVAYSQTLAAAAGTTPYTWTVTSGALPAGLTLSTAGVLSGTPTASGLSAFSVQVADSASHVASMAFPLNITAASTLVVSTSSLPGATKGTAYSKTLTGTGGVAPYVWSVSSGVLPAGLSLNTSTGVISGTPSAAGSSNFVVLLSDSASHVAMKSLSITVSAPPAYTPPKDDHRDYDKRWYQDYFYGQFLDRGDKVSAYINGLLCGSDVVEKSGQWSILIRADARCHPTVGAPVAFTLNGRPATASLAAVWQPRGLPMDTYGYTLTPSGSTSTTGTASFSGGGLTSGAQVTAYINGVACTSATVTSSGTWALSIGASNSCAPTAGAVVGFTIGSSSAIATPLAVWQSGGNGTYSLTVTTGTGADQLPYQAYGSGVPAGALVLALKSGTTVASATADASGNWWLDIPVTNAAAGDVISFSVNGALATQTVVFAPAGFTPPPGLVLTTSGAGTGTFVAPPNFGTGNVAQVVFTGGTVDQLEAAVIAAGGSGAWVQDSSGNFRLLIVGAPAFLKAAFNASFPAGFTTMTGVMVTRS